MAYRCPECKGTRFEVRRGCSVIIDGVTGEEELKYFDEADDMNPDVWVCVECGEQFDGEDNNGRDPERFTPEGAKA